MTLSTTNSTGVQAVESAGYQVYPNPANDQIQVSGEFEQLTLLNANGATVAKTNGKMINVQSLPAGIYFLKIKKKNGQEVVRKIMRI
ncbi:MAG: T9SS type A sorting domain-containing protein [Tannerellaceae bacterium]|nr:T9SS type A sorting domain-containing protein [Tannerellaceae bacterium]